MTSVAHGTHATHVGHIPLTRPRGMAMVGFLTLLLGAWAGIVAFVGPVWGYHATGTQSWVWNANHWLLHLVPGAVAVAAGLLMMAQAPRHRAHLRGPFLIAGLMAAGAGAWLILGPEVWPMVYSGPVYGPASSHLDAFLNALGANLGPGILLAVFGGMALKSMFKDQPVDLYEAVPAAAADEPVATEPGTARVASGTEPAAVADRPVGTAPGQAAEEPAMAGERRRWWQRSGRRGSSAEPVMAPAAGPEETAIRETPERPPQEGPLP